MRNGETPTLTAREQHLRECYVVAKDGADKAYIEKAIKQMPNYFADYDTVVHFISQEEMQKNHSGLPHGGFVVRNGVTGKNSEHKHVIEYNLQLDSNAEFTASVLVAYARAAYKMHQDGVYGCKTVIDVPPVYLLKESREELLKKFL